MDPSDFRPTTCTDVNCIRLLLDYALDNGPMSHHSVIGIPSWNSELADVFNKIEENEHRVALVIYHSDNRYRFAEALRRVMDQEPNPSKDDEYRVGMLWGAEVWCSPAAPRDTLMVVADIDTTEAPQPWFIIGVTPEKMFL